MPRRLMFAMLTVLVALGGGLFVAAQATTSAGAKSSAAPPGLDHFLCYTANAVAGTTPVFQVPTGVTLLNQFSTKAFRPTFGPIDLHCNPALKAVPAGQFPPKSPSWHLMCFAIKGHQSPNTHIVSVSNQFGSGTLKTLAPNQFCLPSLKSLKTPPVFNPPGPNEIMPDHFTCYPVRKAGAVNFKPPRPVKVQDQFGPLVQVKIGPPTELCVPTQKTIKGVVKAQITNPAAHLLCFTVSATPIISPIWDRNQFGTGELAITKTSTLCLPSSKQLIS